jgi:transcription elongation GreA/GreB family factor
MNALDHTNLNELIASLQDAKYIGAFKAAKVISELADENSRLKQRIMDLEDLIEEEKVVSRWQFVDGEMRKTK